MKDFLKRLTPFCKKYWPVFMILVAVLVFFWRVVIGLVPFPGDFVVGIYYPWLDYKWGFEVGVPVKNPILADIPSFIFPMQTFAVEQLKQGFWPLWNPFILGGTPLLANFQSAPFSPTAIFYFIFNVFDADTNHQSAFFRSFVYVYSSSALESVENSKRFGGNCLCIFRF